MIDDGLDFTPRHWDRLSPPDALARYRRAVLVRKVALGVLIALPALYLIGRYAVQWLWRI